MYGNVLLISSLSFYPLHHIMHFYSPPSSLLCSAPIPVTSPLTLSLCITLAHGVHLQTVSSPIQKWSRELENTAQNYANKCIWGHNSNRRTWPFSYVGENLYTSTGNIQDYGSVVRSWYDEAKYYNYRSNTCVKSKMCGHYTQVRL